MIEGMKEVKLISIKSLLAEIILDKAIRTRRLQCLHNEIEDSLIHGDKERFLALTSELNELKKLEIE